MLTHAPRWAAACLATLTLTACLSAAEPLTFNDGDNVCLIGNELGERMQHHNFFETLLHQHFADKKLSVRNLCFPGDEVDLRIRSMNFGDLHQHLGHSKANVVLFFFGYGESFDGKKGLAKFEKAATDLVESVKSRDYSGEGPPRIVLVSPIAFENTGRKHLPNGEAHNQRLAMYTEALRDVAEATDVGFANIFAPSKEILAGDDTLTYDGAHLTAEGYRKLAPAMLKALTGVEAKATFNPSVKAVVDDKNFHWWHRYRAVNGYSIYGKRGEAGYDGTYRNRDVMEREREILDQMTNNRDERLWLVAAGKKITGRVDDSNTLPFLNVKTNVGGANDPNRKRGKLGSLEYLPAAEQQKLFRLAPGYEINLVASEEQFPELANPVSLNFDNKGRLWVTTMQSYPHWKPKTKLNDKVLIFEDDDKDGRADRCKVFAEGLHQPTGFEIGRGGVWVAQQPDILFLQDTDGDDKADVSVRRLVGFDSADSHHGIAAFEWGPDGGLYFQEGTFKFSQVEDPYGVTRLHEAGVWRYSPVKETVDVHASLAFANPWGHVFDRWGQNFIADASPGFNYWAAPISGRMDYPLKHPGGSQHRRIAKETGGDPKYQHKTFIKKRTRPSAGAELISSRHFPPEDQGDFLLCNVIGDRSVLNHGIREDGSGFVGEEKTPLVYCDDGNFRPIDIQFAPDGSLYIVDWHNALIGHLQHNLRDPNRDHQHGRIWRVTYKGRPLVDAPKIAGQPIPELLELLKTYENRTRYQARRELAERNPSEVIEATQQWVSKLDEKDEKHTHHLLEALWVFQTHGHLPKDLLQRLLNVDDHRARAAAVRALSFWLDEVDEPLALLRKRVNDSHPRVRLEAVRACSFLEGDAAIETALDVLNHPTDAYIEYTLDETMRQLER